MDEVTAPLDDRVLRATLAVLVDGQAFLHAIMAAASTELEGAELDLFIAEQMESWKAENALLVERIVKGES